METPSTEDEESASKLPCAQASMMENDAKTIVKTDTETDSEFKQNLMETKSTEDDESASKLPSEQAPMMENDDKIVMKTDTETDPDMNVKTQNTEDDDSALKLPSAQASIKENDVKAIMRTDTETDSDMNVKTQNTADDKCALKIPSAQTSIEENDVKTIMKTDTETDPDMNVKTECTENDQSTSKLPSAEAPIEENDTEMNLDQSVKTFHETIYEISTLEPKEMLNEFTKMIDALVEELNKEYNQDFFTTLLKILCSITDPWLQSSEILMVLTYKTKLHNRFCNFILLLGMTSDIQELAVFWENLLEYCNRVIDYVPGVALNFVPKILKSISMAKSVAADKIVVNDDEFDNLIKKVASLTTHEDENEITYSGLIDFSLTKDFRETDVYPSYKELMSPLGSAIYPNIIKGKYENIEQYLNIHFRLLREDFIKPLREDFQRYFNNPATQLNNIKIYQNVKILGIRVISKQVGCLLQLTKQEMIHHSAQFLEGSLIMLTMDRFKHIIFATALRQDKEFNNQQVLIRINSERYIEPYVGKKCMIAEATVYFDQYKNVLQALKTFNEDNFPLKEYLIDVSNQSQLPSYFPKDFDLNSLMENRAANLNDSQYVAYKHALRNKLSIIQGPPGTGKTYLGLDIAKTLLSRKVRRYYQGPILVVCYRNHALDRFLMGLRSVTINIVRIGAPSNSCLDWYNIREWRHRRNKYQECEHYLDDLTFLYGRLYDLDYIAYDDEEDDFNFMGDDDDEWNYFKSLSYDQRMERMRCVDGNTRLRKIAYYNEELCTNLLNRYYRYRDLKDLDILREAQVIGVTTAGAARMHAVLQQLECPIVIVEEAAEVLEAHVLAALSKECKHLILIGDHQQLRPSTADYKMDTEYNLGTSLFERMILNNMQCNTLMVQHRMRPTIAKLISPIIYPDLENYKAVYHYPPVKGLDKNLFFIQHTHKESITAASKLNVYEAKYIIAFARYLVLNNPKPDKITILSAYLAQYYELVRLSNQDESLEGVRIEVLDNYQGEENDIVLVSLVRNNDEGNIGFLRIENRVCVALSRAKQGLYIMGNIHLLASKSEVWQKVKTELIAQDALGTEIVVRCEKHLDHATTIKDVTDFTPIYNGGCDIPCTATLNCGHKCPQTCHRTSHSIYKCMEDCETILCEVNHKCPLRCHEECKPCMIPKQIQLNCGHRHEVPCHIVPEEYLCPIELTTDLPCNHRVPKPCHADVEKFDCPEKCNAELTCGHTCSLNCHIFNDPEHLEYKCNVMCIRPYEECSSEPKHRYEDCCWERKVCAIMVEKMYSKCSHIVVMYCYLNPDDFHCDAKCEKILECGHTCNLLCSDFCDEAKCMVQISVQLPCGHMSTLPCYLKDSTDESNLLKRCYMPVEKVRSKCSHKMDCLCHEDPDAIFCEQKCEKVLSCGHTCGLKCSDACDSAKCNAPLDILTTLSCGHTSFLPCKLKDCNDDLKLIKFCSTPCGVLLKCTHYCTGTCMTCQQGRMHVECTAKCPKLLFCGHNCPGLCNEICKPCPLQCNYKCTHASCYKICGAPCFECTKPCIRGCKHHRCVRLCWEDCSVPPCDEPCDKILDCGHACIGFCGEPCPDLCRICDKDLFTEQFVGSDDARFIQLVCGDIFESEGFKNWLSGVVSNAAMMVCPKCHNSLLPLQRYNEYVRSIYKQLDRRTLELCADGYHVVQQKALLKMLYKTLYIRDNNSQAYSTIRACVKSLDGVVFNRNRPQYFGFFFEMWETRLKTTLKLADLFNRTKDPAKLEEVNKAFVYLITTNLPYLSEQQIHDIDAEIARIENSEK